MAGCASYPSYNALQVWAKGIGEDPLWGTAFAAKYCREPQSLNEFQQFQHEAYAWATGGIGLVVEYYLGFMQSHGFAPGADGGNGISELNPYLDAVLGKGHPNLNTVKPQGGLGYPPGSPTSFTQGYSGPSYVEQADGTWVPASAAAPGGGTPTAPGGGSPTPTPTSGIFAALKSVIEANPIEAAAVGGVLGLLIVRR